jgi:hypothetical protein
MTAMSILVAGLACLEQDCYPIRGLSGVTHHYCPSHTLLRSANKPADYIMTGVCSGTPDSIEG